MIFQLFRYRVTNLGRLPNLSRVETSQNLAAKTDNSSSTWDAFHPHGME
jgi:hypothetical protein